MIWAFDKDGVKVFADEAFVKHDYFCPMCGESLVLKKGEVRVPHFAHHAKSICCDPWHYDMTDWHREWQERFPRNTQEIVMDSNGEKHRADVCVGKTVIEFQHSPLSFEEFDERNAFYTSLGYKVVWLFDVVEPFHDDSIEESINRTDVYKWRRPKTTFKHFDYKSRSIELYFQTEDCVDDEGPNAGICKVTWVSPDGFEHFAMDGQWLNHEEFVEIFIPKVRKPVASDLDLDLIEIGHRDHTVFYKCPIAKSGKSINMEIDMRASDDYPLCSTCKYNRGFKCAYYRLSAGIQDGADVKQILRDKYGSPTTAIIEESGVEKKIPFSQEAKRGKSIIQLWRELNPSVAAFMNLKTGKYVRISKNPIDQISRYGKCYGKWSYDGYRYSNESVELYGITDECWVCTWKKD